VKTDAGAQLRSVIKGLVKDGVATEKTWPYVISRFAKAPSAAAVAEGAALAQQIAKQKLGYYRLSTLDDVLNCLATGDTFVFGFAAPETIENLPKNGVLPLPTKTTKIVGGHAVVGVGYDQKQGFIWVRNSWGPTWGLNGYFKMPFGWFTDPRRLVDDMWTLK
jgi:C1A family cysteine protease